MSTSKQGPSTGRGGVRVRQHKGGQTFEIRFRTADGERRFEVVGRSGDGTTRRDAERLLEQRLAEVRLGVWVDPRAAPEPEDAGPPTLHEVATDWLAAERITVTINEEGRPVVTARGRAETTAASTYRSLVSALWHFADPEPGGGRSSWPVDRLTARDVRTWLIAMTETAVPRPPDPDAPASRPVSTGTARRMGQVLVRVLDLAVEDGHLPRNVAAGPVRALRPERVRKPAIERAAHIEALLAAASRLDARPGDTVGHRRAFVSALVFTGARISEVLALRWADVDIPGGCVRIRGTKSDAADRHADLLPRLHEDLQDLRLERAPRPEHFVFPTAVGSAQSHHNARRRWFAETVEEANRALRAAGEPLIETEGTGKVTPHALRRTFITVVVAMNWDLGRVMDTVGHASVAMTMETYRRQINRRDGSLEALCNVYFPGTVRLAGCSARSVRL